MDLYRPRVAVMAEQFRASEKWPPYVRRALQTFDGGIIGYVDIDMTPHPVLDGDWLIWDRGKLISKCPDGRFQAQYEKLEGGS